MAKDHRTRPRLPASGKARLLWEDSGTPQEAVSEIHDVSSNGFSCWMPRRLERGIRVRVEARTLNVVGYASVRHSRAVGLRYLVGFQFDGNLRWLAPGEQPVKPRWT